MDIRNIIDNYLRLYPQEKSQLHLLLDAMDQHDDIISRKNFDGHITASAFLVDAHSKKVLLLEHKLLQQHLQPGGHIDGSHETPYEAAIRELKEETGIDQSDLVPRHVMPQNTLVPFDIDTHGMPANPAKDEPEHYHHDFRYLFLAQQGAIQINTEESSNYKWMDWDDFTELENFRHVADKISSVLAPNAHDYFASLACANSKDIAVLSVAHIIPSSEDFLESLDQNFNLIGIIPKPKSINPNSLDRIIKQNISVLSNFSRENITQDPSELIALLKGYNNICLIDIGGYFAGAAHKLQEALGPRLLGIIEDTENGQKKYEKLSEASTRIVSVARSPLKNFEDKLVGHGIAHAAETLLRQDNILITYKECGIIGYGKIGRGIAQYLQQRGIQPMVCEKDALRLVQASCDGAKAVLLPELLKHCDVIFCATGARVLDLVMLRDLKNNAYVASATSSEDEFDLSAVTNEYEKENIDHNITRYAKRGHVFHLMNDGNAINFLFSAAVDTYICLVQGELLYSVCKLYERKFSETAIATNSSEEHEYIARSWLQYLLRTEATL